MIFFKAKAIKDSKFYLQFSHGKARFTFLQLTFDPALEKTKTHHLIVLAC